MKTLPAIALLFLVSLLLCACPYKSDVGIDNGPSLKMNTALLGTWHKASYPSDSTELIFTRSSAQKYLLTAIVNDGLDGYETSHYEIWFSKIGQLQLVSFYDTKDKKYSFGELALTGNLLDIKLLSDDNTSKQFNSVAEMKKFVEDIYDENRVLYDHDVDLGELIKAK